MNTEDQPAAQSAAQPAAQPADQPTEAELHQIAQRRQHRKAALREAGRKVPINFSVVGVQKGATGTLYGMLKRHPQVAGGPQKEMRFFLNENRDWSEPRYRRYARPADGPQVVAAGDATPAYFFWPNALERMQRYRADMRLVVSLRDPVERAMSHWSMERVNDPGFPDLRECVERFGFVATEDLPLARLRKISMFARGRYGEQLQRGLSLFPHEQWLVLDFRDIVGDHERTLDRVTDHLGLHRFVKHPRPAHRNATPRDNTGRTPDLEQFTRLVESYDKDLTRLQELSGLDVAGWPTSRVLTGDLDVAVFRETVLTKLGLEP